MRQRALRIVAQAPDQRGQQSRLRTGGARALGEAPRIECVKVRQFEPFERVAAQASGGVLELLERAVIQLPIGERLERGDVDDDVRGVEPYCDPVGEDARTCVVIHEAPQLGKAPPQRAARVIGNLPEQLAQVLAAECAAVQREVREQGARLPRRR